MASHSLARSVPVGDAGVSFESRLIEARAQREKVLAERAANNYKTDQKPAPTSPLNAEQQGTLQAKRGHAQMEELGPTGAPQAVTKSTDLKTLAAKVVLVFSAAVGFGIGITFAAGNLSGSWTPSVPSHANVNVTQQALVREQPAEATSEVLPVAVLTEAGSLAVHLQAELVASDVGSEEAVPILEFSKGIFTRAEISPLDTDTFRDLPDKLALEVDQIARLVEERKPFRVFVHAPDGIPSNELDEYVAEMEASGAQVAQIGREPFRVSQTHLRFYSEDAAENARSLARSLDIDARDFSQTASSSDRIEVWVAGPPMQVTKNEPETPNVFQRVLRSLTEGSE